MTDFLNIYLRKYFFRPDHAIFRAAEAERLANFPIHPQVLDLACGDGTFGNAFLPQDTVGVDLDLDSIRKARNAGGYAALAVSDAGALPFKTASFQTVVSNCAMEHMPHLDAVLREVARVLRPGGAFVFTVPPDTFANILVPYRIMQCIGFRARAQRYLKAFNENLKMIHFMSEPQWRDRLCEANLELVETHYYLPGSSGMLWSFLFHVLSSPVPLPDKWKKNGAAELLRRIVGNSLLGFWIALMQRVLWKHVAREGKPGKPAAGIALCAVRRNG
jgi:SAM-dependent methyltransferase